MASRLCACIKQRRCSSMSFSWVSCLHRGQVATTINNVQDMSMPVMDGMSATRAIRQYEQEYNIPRCCIIALTGLASASAKLEAWNSGIDHFMTKPVNFKALEKFLKKEESKRNDKRKAEEDGAVEVSKSAGR